VTDFEARIRDATGADAEAVTRLWTEGYVVPGGGRSVPYAEADYLESARHGRIAVAEFAGDLVGVVVLYAPDAPRRAVAEAGEAELSRLAVAVQARRHGVGRALARWCEAQARAEGWRAIALWSRPAQTAAHRLYESLGYSRLPERDSIDAGGDRLVFRLALDSPTARTRAPHLA
jgi:ribosomal protein S18 acetylase RimI-like enzyme